MTVSFILFSGVFAQTQAERCFSQTGYCISGRVREVWEHGTLAIFGFPITAQQQMQIEGQLRSVQWFERGRIEIHPDRPYPYDVLLGRLGAEQLARNGQDWAASRAQPQPGCTFFQETGHNVCDPFYVMWQAHGRQLDQRRAVSIAESLALFGLPLTEAQVETIDGTPYLTQWFERARFELHSDTRPPNIVLLGRLGAELYGEWQSRDVPGGDGEGAQPGVIDAMTGEAWRADGVPPERIENLSTPSFQSLPNDQLWGEISRFDGVALVGLKRPDLAVCRREILFGSVNLCYSGMYE
jgi:hypothetical protein